MLGADIEFFIRNSETGKVTPACGIVGGTKEQCIQINDTYGILEDGAAVELNYAPTADRKKWVGDIFNSAKIINAHLNGRFEVALRTEFYFPDIKNYPQAMEIGCLPDFDAYGKNPDKARKVPSIKKFGGFRFSGGHIHISYALKDRFPAWVVAKLMDLLVLLPTLGRATKDGAEALLGPQRRRFYGLPGLYRPKEYGMEYRVFSNAFSYSLSHITTLSAYLDALHTRLNNPDNGENLEQIFVNTNWGEVKDAVERLDTAKMMEIYNGASRQLT